MFHTSHTFLFYWIFTRPKKVAQLGSSFFRETDQADNYVEKNNKKCRHYIFKCEPLATPHTHSISVQCAMTTYTLISFSSEFLHNCLGLASYLGEPADLNKASLPVRSEVGSQTVSGFDINSYYVHEFRVYPFQWPSLA